MNVRILISAASMLALAACGAGGSGAITPTTASRGLAPQSSASNPTTKLKCFTGGNATCVLTDDGAILNNPAPGDYSGVYIASADNLKGRPLAAIGQLQFTYVSAAPTAGGGSPRFSLPYATDGKTTIWAYIQATTCNGSTPSGGTVDIHAAACTIATSAGGAYPNYPAFAAANPSGTVNGLPFVVADEPGHYTLTNVLISRT
jgi:hypothetical protein